MNPIFTVTQINNYSKTLLENKLQKVFIKGEVSSVNTYGTKYIYFTIKDSESSISCVSFNQHSIKIKEGLSVTIYGDVTLYTQRGKYQIIVKDILLSGEGKLWMQFNELKKTLSNEGIFDDINKNKLPKYPSSIGIVTSKNGAVMHDIINILKRRAPYIKIIIRDTKVQGSESSTDIINALKDFNKYKNIDMLIICRGGGSIDDLMPFNNEKLIRFLYNYKIPTISAVGHQVDYTLCDLVCDVRASTPSEAAELCVLDKDNLLKKINTNIDNIKNQIFEKIKSKKIEIDIMTKNIPIYLHNKINLSLNRIIKYDSKIKEITDNYLMKKKNFVRSANLLLKNINPKKIQSKGFSIIKFKNNVINNTRDVNVNDNLDINLFKGELIVKIIKKMS